MADTLRAPYEEHPDQLELPLLDAEVAIFCNPRLNRSVRAKPMQLGVYLELRGWRKDYPDLDLEQEGYLIERPDIGPPNHPDFPFFVAWLSKTSFEMFYHRGKCSEYNVLTVVGPDGQS